MKMFFDITIQLVHVNFHHKNTVGHQFQTHYFTHEFYTEREIMMVSFILLT